jgi:STE24 endopeptidase
MGQARRVGELAWWSAAGALAVLGVAALVTHPGAALPSGASAMATAGLDTFDVELLAEVAAYRSPRRVAGLVLLALSVGMPLGAAVLLARGDRRVRHVALWAAVIVLSTALARLPVVGWVRIVHDGRFKMRNQSPAAWLADHLLAVGTRAAAVAVAAVGVAALVRRAPRLWPAQLTVAATAVALLVVLLHPVVVHPLLLPERPLPEGEHRDAVALVVARSGMDVPVTLGIASTRTPRRNAVATGLGPTRRIVLHDTLLELAPADVAALTAHELAHLEHRDLLRGALATAPVVLAGGLLGAVLLRRSGRRRTDDAARVLVIGVAFVLAAEAAATPLVAAQSRRIEVAADARAVVLAGAVEPLLVTLRAFTVDDLADPDPPRWSALLSTHPSVGERIRAALDVAEQAGLDVDVEQVLSAEASRPARR